MLLTDTGMAAALAPAGLQFIERVQGEVGIPPRPGKTAASSLSEDGRFDAGPDEIAGHEETATGPRE